MPESFGKRLKARRESTVDVFGRLLSIAACARLFDVTISTWRHWEREKFLPDYRNRKTILEKWPDMF